MSDRRSLGKVQVQEGRLWLTLGNLVYDFDHQTTLMSLDLEVALPLIRLRDGGDKIRAVCFPYENIPDPPYLSGELQYCKTSKLRQNLGYVYSDQDAHGKTRYSVVLLREAIRKALDPLWLHLHVEKGEGDGQQEAGE